MDAFIKYAQIFGPIATALGVFVAIWALRANHDWNRRNFTAALIGQWNEKTSIHRQAIEKIKPGLVDLNKKWTPVEITKAEAENIYTAKAGTDEWLLRFHFIELLNYFETIASAYNNKVADQIMIEESMKGVLVRWHDILVNYIHAVEAHRGYQPWSPFLTVIDEWKKKTSKPRRPAA